MDCEGTRGNERLAGGCCVRPAKSWWPDLVAAEAGGIWRRADPFFYGESSRVSRGLTEA